jgi:signal transduction histidine kinase/CheY-like chemotaxis protein|tara:strand:- start:1750 stop:3159 length:1410 start_codon:yes stop_codon:yes gene_type:complete
VAGRTTGVIWAMIAVVTLWIFAYLQFNDFNFEFAPALPGPMPLIFAFEASLVLLMLTLTTFVFRSAQHNAETKLNTTVHQLEKEVHDRTLAEAEARQSEQSQATFLATMSHELRTPLNGVIGASQMLIDGELSKRQRELVDVVLQSSETLLELINDVLDLSRLDSNEIKLKSIPVDLRDLVSSTIAPLSFQAKEKGIKFTLTIEDDIPAWVMGDPTRLRQIILNLVGNAVKFTSTGEISVVLDTALERIRLKISDTGIGIPKQVQASLFEPYVQAEVATMRKFGGSGLGLTIVKKLISAMKGKIAVDSVPGRGSTFTIFIPLQVSVAPLKRSGPDPEIKLPKLSIVVADGNAVNRMVLSRMLEGDGHQVVSMSNGREVIEYLKDHNVNLVLMDLQMPVMDGVSATRKIRAMQGKRSRTPVIAVTANVISEKPEHIMAQGMNAYLQKPFRKTELREALQQALTPTSRLAH